MKKYIISISLTILALIVYKKCKREDIYIRCRVVSHDMTEDRGAVHYHTIVNCENGQIIDEQGLGYYSLSIGSYTTDHQTYLVIDTSK